MLVPHESTTPGVACREPEVGASPLSGGLVSEACIEQSVSTVAADEDGPPSSLPRHLSSSEPSPALRRTGRATAGQHFNLYHLPHATS